MYKKMTERKKRGGRSLCGRVFFSGVAKKKGGADFFYSFKINSIKNQSLYLYLRGPFFSCKNRLRLRPISLRFCSLVRSQRRTTKIILMDNAPLAHRLKNRARGQPFALPTGSKTEPMDKTWARGLPTGFFIKANWFFQIQSQSQNRACKDEVFDAFCPASWKKNREIWTKRGSFLIANAISARFKASRRRFLSKWVG